MLHHRIAVIVRPLRHLPPVRDLRQEEVPCAKRGQPMQRVGDGLRRVAQRGGITRVAQQNAQQLRLPPLRRDVPESAGVRLRRRKRTRFDGKAEFARYAHHAQDAQRIRAHRSRPGLPDHAGCQVVQPAERVENLAACAVGIQRVDREVPPGRILLQRRAETNGLRPVRAAGGIPFGAKGCIFHRFAVNAHADRAKRAACVIDRPGGQPGGTAAGLDRVRRQRPGCVEIGLRQAEQRVAHRPANQIDRRLQYGGKPP